MAGGGTDISQNLAQNCEPCAYLWINVAITYYSGSAQMCGQPIIDTDTDGGPYIFTGQWWQTSVVYSYCESEEASGTGTEAYDYTYPTGDEECTDTYTFVPIDDTGCDPADAVNTLTYPDTQAPGDLIGMAQDNAIADAPDPVTLSVTFGAWSCWAGWGAGSPPEFCSVVLDALQGGQSTGPDTDGPWYDVPANPSAAVSWASWTFQRLGTSVPLTIQWVETTYNILTGDVISTITQSIEMAAGAEYSDLYDPGPPTNNTQVSISDLRIYAPAWTAP